MSDTAARNQQAARFRALHVPGQPLLLANVWDAATARIVEQAGAVALATSSAAVANALGYPDGNALPAAEQIAATARIAAVIGIPLSVDAEAGYSDAPAEAAQTVGRLLEVGAVGINLEDGAAPPALLAEKIRAIRTHAARIGRDVFINARTDVFLRGLVADAEAVEETLRRLALYRDAGADGGFVPGLVNLERLSSIATASAMPLNAMVVPGIADVAALAAAGVARISLGGGAFLACLSLARRIAEELLRGGTYTAMGEASAISHREANGLFAARRTHPEARRRGEA